MNQELSAAAVLPRGDRMNFETIAAPADPLAVRAEIGRLRETGPLVSQSRFDVFLAEAAEIPHVLQEIGRLREISFRAVGEGSGKALDLDRYDAFYLHLFLWDREAETVAGAYRLGRTDDLLARLGAEGLYTSTLFQLGESFLDHLTPGLELGRSFVVPAYQKSIHPLGLLWRGIGRFVARHPRYARLFGPVSISNDYSPLSRDLIVRFMRGSRRDAHLAGCVRPLHPYLGELPSAEDISVRLDSIEEVSAAIARLEPDGKGVPVLLRQYLKLNATLLEFNVDPDFANVLDALVLVDLREAPDEALARYMGADGLAGFRATTRPWISEVTAASAPCHAAA